MCSTRDLSACLSSEGPPTYTHYTTTGAGHPSLKRISGGRRSFTRGGKEEGGTGNLISYRSSLGVET